MLHIKSHLPGGLPESGRQFTLHPNHHHTTQSTPSSDSPKKFTLNSSLYSTMSSLNVPGPSPYASFFRHRTLGRAPSPPTWACYEQIQYDGEYSGDSASDGDSHDEDDDEDDDDEENDRDDSCSEDDEDYGHLPDSPSSSIQSHDPPPSLEESEKSKDSPDEAKKDVKGKGRAVDPEHEVEDPVQPPQSKPRLRSKKRHSGHRSRTLRPILTIHKSQGFVWNQVGSDTPLYPPPEDDQTLIPFIIRTSSCPLISRIAVSQSLLLDIQPLCQLRIAHFSDYMLLSLADFRHRIDLATELPWICLVFRLVHCVLPGL